MTTDEWHLEPFGELGQDEMAIQDPPSVDIAFPPLRETTTLFLKLTADIEAAKLLFSP